MNSIAQLRCDGSLDVPQPQLVALSSDFCSDLLQLVDEILNRHDIIPPARSWWPRSKKQFLKFGVRRLLRLRGAQGPELPVQIDLLCLFSDGDGLEHEAERQLDVDRVAHAGDDP